jgi:hypothetical protein
MSDMFISLQMPNVTPAEEPSEAADDSVSEELKLAEAAAAAAAAAVADGQYRQQLVTNAGSDGPGANPTTFEFTSTTPALW